MTLTDEAGDFVLPSDSLRSTDAYVLASNEQLGELLGDDDREVRLFISSTFVDMEAERDLLIRNVFPSLSAFCAERGVRLVPFDLRWGITEAQSRQGSTIEVRSRLCCAAFSALTQRYSVLTQLCKDLFARG